MDLLSQYAYYLASGFYNFVSTGLDYLRRAVLGSPPETRPVGAPYTPPFTGGQCSGASYRLAIKWNDSSGTRYAVFGGENSGGGTEPPAESTVRSQGAIVTGPISGVSGTELLFGFIWRITINGVTVQYIPPLAASSFQIHAVYRVDGGTDNCGDLPNPNPNPPISSDGLAESDPPDFAGPNSIPITTGTPLPPDGSEELIEEAQEELEEAALLAPTNLAGAIAKIALGLARLVELLALINDLIALLKKLFNPGNKSSFSYNYGNLRYDGYIEFFPTIRPTNVTPLYLDLQATTLKTWASRYLGEKSPNYWNREPIGFIHFTAPTMGILSTHEIRFSRTSIPIPPLARGFFYHLGLDGTNRMNASGFYLKQE